MMQRSIVFSLAVSIVAMAIGIILLRGLPDVSVGQPLRAAVPASASVPDDEVSRLREEIETLKQKNHDLRVQIKTRNQVIKQYEAQLEELRRKVPSQPSIYRELKAKTKTDAEVTHEALRILGDMGITRISFAH